jgi:putative ABC transport system permease protein
VTLWLVIHTIRRAPRRIVLGALGVAFPVAMLAATLLFVENAVHDMTPAALKPVQIEMRALATSLDVDVSKVSRQLAAVPSVTRVEPFASTSVVVGIPGTPGGITARLFAVEDSYLSHHPWLKVTNGTLGKGALVDQAVRAWPGFADLKNVTISLPGDAPILDLSLPVGGTVDLRGATTWFSIPYGEVQGDIVTLPRAMVIPYATFRRSVLPVLKSWEKKGGLPPFDPGSGELPSVSLEAHVTVDHAAYPSDPGRAAVWSGQLRRILEKQVPGQVLVADNGFESLSQAQADATNAKILFLLLGIPGVLVAAALGLAAASALSEARRREEALLRLRGATGGQIARVAAGHAAAAGILGSVVGLVVAVLTVTVVVGQVAWRGVPAGRLAFAAILSVAVGLLVTAVRLVRLRRAGRKSEVATQRRLLERGWTPTWRRAHLDLVALGVGGAILFINIKAGGLQRTPIEGTALALSFYVLLAPIALWVGGTLLVIRGLLSLLSGWARPEHARPLPSWRGASLRWLGRRPARTAVALVLGALAVAFGTYVLAFAATYRTAKQADAQAAIGSDLRLTPGDPLFKLPNLGPDVASTSEFRLVPARAGGDRKTILGIDPASYAATATMAPRLLAGQGVAVMAKDPAGVLISSEIATDFAVGPGDTLPITIFPDDFENRRTVPLHVVGVYRSFPPSSPIAEMVASAASLPRALISPPDFYLARVAPGRSATEVAARLHAGILADKFGVSTVTDPSSRGLTALNLTGLGRIESLGGGLVAAVGVAVLGAFLVLERRREFAILRAVGADTPQVLTGPAHEGFIAVLGSLVIGIPIGLGLSILAVRVLGLFFALPPPLLTMPSATLALLCLFMVAVSAIALGATLLAVNRVRAASVLREV